MTRARDLARVRDLRTVVPLRDADPCAATRGAGTLSQTSYRRTSQLRAPGRAGVTRARDLARVRDLRTVVHLRDADTCAAELARGFVATPACVAVARAVLARLAERLGGGVFVQRCSCHGTSQRLACQAVPA